VSQYYWEADSGDVGGMPNNASVSQPWHNWDSLSVESSSTHVDFPYALKGVANSTGFVRRVAAFASIGGNTLSQSGVTQIYGVVNANKYYSDVGLAGRVGGNDSAETGVLLRHAAPPLNGDTDFGEYDAGTYTAFQAAVDEDLDFPFCIRMEFDGSTVKTRFWAYGDAEPVTWNYTDTTGVTGDGDWGLHSGQVNYADTEFELLAFGFGNDGDAALKEPVPAGGESYDRVLADTAVVADTDGTLNILDLVRTLLDNTDVEDAVATEAVLSAVRVLQDRTDVFDEVLTARGISRLLQDSAEATDAVISAIGTVISIVLGEQVDTSDGIKLTAEFDRALANEVSVDDVISTAQSLARLLGSDAVVNDSVESYRDLVRILDAGGVDVLDAVSSAVGRAITHYIRTLLDNVDLTDDAHAAVVSKTIDSILVAIVAKHIVVSTKEKNIDYGIEIKHINTDTEEL